MSIPVTTYINPSPKQALDMPLAWDLHNRGRQLYVAGKYAEAQQVYKRALQIKLSAFGPRNHNAAVGYNALGEVYMKLGRPDEAEQNLRKAIPFALNDRDKAYYRENLAQVYEMKHDLAKAKEIRMQGSPDYIYCAYENCTVCPLPQPLKYCSGCKSIFYCSEACQKKDWKRHRKYHSG